MPASAAAFSGACMAVTSVGATSSASGFLATTESMIGFCRVGSNFSGPCTSTVMFAALAASWMPHCMEM